MDQQTVPLKKQWYNEHIGDQTEQRFFAACSKWLPTEPDWFFGVEEPSAVLDLRGVDFIAWVRYKNDRAVLPVPIQVKSSTNHVARWYKAHPSAKAARVVVIVVKSHHSELGIRNNLFTELRKVRDEQIFYQSYLAQTGKKPVNERGQKFLQKIEAKRARRQAKQGAPIARDQRLTLLRPRLGWLERWYYRLAKLLPAP